MNKWQCASAVIFVLNIAIHTVTPQARGCPPQEAILPCRCLLRGEEYQIWCSHSDLPRVLEGLKAVAQFIFQPIDELILENNYLPSLPGRTFYPLKVMRLMLRYNGLERVSSDWLVGLESSLMELFIVEPNLRSLPDDSLVQLNDLEAITIQTDLLKRLPLFFRLPKLRYLQIESLSLLELLPRSFKDLPALEKFHISGSPRLIRLESGLLDDLPNLKLINISYCGLNWISPRAMSQLPLLKELSLTGNKITDAGMVGRGSRDLPSLEIIRLDRNLVDKLGEASFVDMPGLKNLFLSDNRIRELHHGAFHRVPSLKIVDLNNNILRRVHPESFLQPSGSGLEELRLINNDVSHVAELRSLLDTLPKLTFLDMSHNYLEAIPFGALRGHPTLERLHLDHNKIHLIDPEAFMAMPALRELRLKNNSLSDMLGGPLWNLPSLKGLDLSANLYRRLEPRLLDNLPSLRKLDMSLNDLTTLDPTALLTVPELEHVNMSYNALNTLHPATFRHLLNLYELDLNYNRLVEFAPGLPRGLEYLHLSHNRIESIPLSPSPDLDLPVLRMLDLSNNGIQVIPQGSFKTTPQLRKLYISNNIIHKLDSSSFEGLSRLEFLHLQDNRINNIHPKAFMEMIELQEINLRSNRLDILAPDLFKTTHHLKKIDISKNLLGEILPGTLEHLHELISMDASDNVLVNLPPGLQNLKKLRYLNLINNRLKSVSPEVLSSLKLLTELKVSRNFIQDLKKGAFDSLQHLESLHIDRNEIEIIEPHAFRRLPALKMLKLNHNKLHTIPPHAFSNLPSLQIAELQNNQIMKLAKNAFHIVPHLLFLNLSSNHLTSLEDAGLHSLRPLEVLDISNNRITRIEGSSFEKLEWLVELRMDSNEICSIRGSPFSGMPRLRVISMKNNKMMSFPEKAVQNLRGNIAVLDIDGNPLACTCSILWLKGWLQETSTTGPRCLNGVLVREMRLTLQECSKESNVIEPVAPGCEAELLSAPSLYDTSQVFTPWMKLKANNSKQTNGSKNNIIAPSPEESDYFYDEYVDYPYNETILLENNALTNGNIKEHKSESSTSPAVSTMKSHHYVAGDTPTLYAASKNKSKPNVPKEVHNSPSTSGFTFFGVPLPSINFNSLWGSGNRKERVTSPTPIAERKTAIVNKPARSTPRANILPAMMPPSTPEIETGGFIPILPGSGGFKPIPNPAMTIQSTSDNKTVINERNSKPQNEKNISTQSSNLLPTQIPHTTKEPVSTTEKSSSMGHPLPMPSGPTTMMNTNLPVTDATPKANSKIQTKIHVYESNFSDSKKTETNIEIIKANVKDITTIEDDKLDKTTQIPTTEPLTNEDKPHNISETTGSSVSVQNVITVATSTTLAPQLVNVSTVATISQPVESTKIKGNDSVVTNDKSIGTPLSALLVPGGQQPQFRTPGRSTITKVQSPYTSNNNAPLLQSHIEASEATLQTKETKSSMESVVTEAGADIGTEDTNWYFANYNKTSNEPYVGGTVLKSGGNSYSINYIFIFMIAFSIFFRF